MNVSIGFKLVKQFKGRSL